MIIGAVVTVATAFAQHGHATPEERAHEAVHAAQIHGRGVRRVSRFLAGRKGSALNQWLIRQAQGPHHQASDIVARFCVCGAEYRAIVKANQAGQHDIDIRLDFGR